VSSEQKAITRIGIYGGAFDPIHNGHLATIAQLLASGQVDQVVVVPSGDRPDKKVTVSASDRLLMTERAIAEAFPQDSRVSVSDIHVLGTVGYGTIDLVDYFKSIPLTEPYVVIGRELLPDLPQWKESARLCSIARFMIIDRPGAPAAGVPAGLNASVVRASYQAGVLVSSTTIRALLGQGLSCAGLLPQSVIALCKARGFYGAGA
jgi:nicotinate-nucleotide adenylyltransferase